MFKTKAEIDQEKYGKRVALVIETPQGGGYDLTGVFECETETTIVLLQPDHKVEVKKSDVKLTKWTNKTDAEMADAEKAKTLPPQTADSGGSVDPT